MAQKVLLGMSGGVDSSVAAIVLKNMGYSVTGVTLCLCEKYATTTAVSDAKAVCEKLNIEHIVLDLNEEFENTVIKNFNNEYFAGRTPNPCIVCNKKIKFGKMLDKALELGFDKIATGHYANIVLSDNEYKLLTAADLSKDQSYMLYTLTQRELSHAVFPLGNLTKPQVRKIAEEAGLAVAHKSDSQDICFVPSGDYAAFIKESTGKVCNKGKFLDIDGNFLGNNEGVIHYTIGQRKGLGIALGKPKFVIEKDALNDTVILGDEEHLFYNNVFVTNLSYTNGNALKDGTKILAKLRYRQKAVEAEIYNKDGGVLLKFNEKQRAPSAGQAAVFYIGNQVIGGGTIAGGIK